MEPIINPWMFYLIDQVGCWSIFLFLILLLVGVGLLITVIVEVFSMSDYEPEDVFMIRLKSIEKVLIKLIIPLTIVSLLIPSSSTIYKMVIADNVTPNNIQIVGDTVEDGIDYIFDKINDVVEKQEE